MYNNITLEYISGDKLSKVEYSFYMSDYFEVVLDSYKEYSREIKKKKFKLVKGYFRLNFNRLSSMNLEEVPITSKIIQDAKNNFVSLLKFVKKLRSSELLLKDSNNE